MITVGTDRTIKVSVLNRTIDLPVGSSGNRWLMITLHSPLFRFGICPQWSEMNLGENQKHWSVLCPTINSPKRKTRSFVVFWSIYFPLYLFIDWLLLKNWSILHVSKTVPLLIIIRYVIIRNVYVSFLFSRQWTIDRFFSLLFFSRSSHWSILILLFNNYRDPTRWYSSRSISYALSLSSWTYLIVLLIIIGDIWFEWRQFLSTWSGYKWVNRLESINFSGLSIYRPSEKVRSRW